jgi:hypothetical protein
MMDMLSGIARGHWHQHREKRKGHRATPQYIETVEERELSPISGPQLSEFRPNAFKELSSIEYSHKNSYKYMNNVGKMVSTHVKPANLAPSFSSFAAGPLVSAVLPQS